MEEKYLNFEIKARYIQSGALNANTENIWIVLHGYGQLASYFLKNFKILESSTTCLIAPEGLSRFYLNGFSGRVGATWMTKEDRLTDIENNLNYLNNLYTHIVAPFQTSGTKVTLLGFSQGCATLMRWIVENHVIFDRMILWAGVVPPDLDFIKGKKLLKNKESYFIYGYDDPFLEETSLESIFKLFEILDIHPRVYTFKGGHEINDQILKKFI